MRTVLWILALCAVVGGAGIVATSLPDSAWGRVDPSPLGGGVALGAVGLTSAIALLTSATFTQQRKQATEALLREQRAAAYRDILAGMIRSFMDVKTDVAHERATVAMWASPSSIEVFERWFTYASGTNGDIPEIEKPHMYSLLGDCIVQMRRDLGLETDLSSSGQHSLMQMIFAKYADDLVRANELLKAGRKV